MSLAFYCRPIIDTQIVPNQNFNYVKTLFLAVKRETAGLSI